MHQIRPSLKQKARTDALIRVPQVIARPVLRVEAFVLLFVFAFNCDPGLFL